MRVFLFDKFRRSFFFGRGEDSTLEADPQLDFKPADESLGCCFPIDSHAESGFDTRVEHSRNSCRSCKQSFFGSLPGRFVFEKARPGESRVQVRYSMRETSGGTIPLSHGQHVNVKPGETAQESF